MPVHDCYTGVSVVILGTHIYQKGNGMLETIQVVFRISDGMTTPLFVQEGTIYSDETNEKIKSSRSGYLVYVLFKNEYRDGITADECDELLGKRFGARLATYQDSIGSSDVRPPKNQT